MIKLIVADMDGCLLDPGEKLPINFREAYDLMTRQNVIFAAASGRSVDGLKGPFGHMTADMAFAFHCMPQYRRQKIAGVQKELRLTFVTTFGVKHNEHKGIVDNEITLEDMFE